MPELSVRKSAPPRLQLTVLLFLSISVAASLVPWPRAASAQLFQDTFATNQDLKAFLAKRGHRYPSISGAFLNSLVNGRTYDNDQDNNQQAPVAAGQDDSTTTNDNDDDNNTDGVSGLDGPEVYLLEDKDYPKSVYENYSDFGQVSGIASLPSGDIAVFHRVERELDHRTYEIRVPIGKAQDNLIKNDTITIIDGETGETKLSLGANLFFMPHGITSDSKGNLWVTDVGRSQVMRLPTGMIDLNQLAAATNTSTAGSANNKQRWLPGHLSRLWPDLILGEAFVSGRDDASHFCKPAEVLVSPDDRLVYVADGYCGNRVIVFTGDGSFVKSFGEEEQMNVVHSLALFKERNLLCAADRQNARILCFKAGLDGDLESLGELVLRVNYPIGTVWAITAIDADHLVVSGKEFDTHRYSLAILNPFKSTIKQVWTSSDLLIPHSLTQTSDGRYVYAAELSHGAYKKVFRYFVIRERSTN